MILGKKKRKERTMWFDKPKTLDTKWGFVYL